MFFSDFSSDISSEKGFLFVWLGVMISLARFSLCEGGKFRPFWFQGLHCDPKPARAKTRLAVNFESVPLPWDMSPFSYPCLLHSSSHLVALDEVSLRLHLVLGGAMKREILYEEEHDSFLLFLSFLLPTCKGVNSHFWGLFLVGWDKSSMNIEHLDGSTFITSFYMLLWVHPIIFLGWTGFFQKTNKKENFMINSLVFWV